MGIGNHPATRFFRPDAAGPNLRPPEEESLLGSESVDRLTRLARLSLLECLICERQTAKICHAFTYNEFTLKVQSWLSLKRIKLLDHTISAFAKVFVVFRCPPVNEITFRVEASAGIIEAVRHLMSNHCAHPTVVDRLVCERIIKRRLHNSRGKNDLVH